MMALILQSSSSIRASALGATLPRESSIDAFLRIGLHHRACARGPYAPAHLRADRRAPPSIDCRRRWIALLQRVEHAGHKHLVCLEAASYPGNDLLEAALPQGPGRPGLARRQRRRDGQEVAHKGCQQLRCDRHIALQAVKGSFVPLLLQGDK